MKFLVLILIVAFSCLQCNPGTKGVEAKDSNITTSQAASLAKEGYILIDLRTNGEIEEHGTIQGSLSIDFKSSDFEKQVSQLSKNEKYILYCRSGRRSSNALSTFEAQSLVAYNMLGGYTEWIKTKN